MLAGTVQEDNQLLQVLMDDQANLGGIFAPGPYWNANSQRILRGILDSGLSDFRRNARIGKGYVDVRISNPFDLVEPHSKTYRMYRFLTWFSPTRKILKDYGAFIENIQGRLTSSVSQNLLQTHVHIFEKYGALLTRLDTMVGAPEHFLEWNDKQISHVYVRQLNRLENFSSVTNFSQKKTFMEIGGGFGVNTHLVSELYNNIEKLLYIDIPPMLYVGTQYLKSVCRNEIFDYCDYKKQRPRTLAEISERVICLPTWALLEINFQWDVCWNSASFQEMSTEQIRYYLSWLAANRQQTDAELLLIFYTAKNQSIGIEGFQRAAELELHPVTQEYAPNPGNIYYRVTF